MDEIFFSLMALHDSIVGVELGLSWPKFRLGFGLGPKLFRQGLGLIIGTI